jgi:septum formation protein
MTCCLVRHLIGEEPLILGSLSPRRSRILDGLGLEFLVDPSGIPEDALEGEDPEEHVRRLALAKATEVASRHARGTVVGADTIVLLGGRLLGKPDGPPEASEMLRAIRGRWHEVLTGVAAVRASDGASAVGAERTRVLVRDLSDEEVDEYVASGEPLDKAGSYAIQDCGAAVVERVEGCFYNVVGLPVVRLCRVLDELAAVGRRGGHAEE